MFFDAQKSNVIERYISYLKAIGAFSNLYSSSRKPFVQYRVAENAFCKAFGAENLARADVAYDALIEGYGIGIKTFILSGNSKLEKVAEFNSYSSELRKLKGIGLAEKLADYRNERILFADRTYNVSDRIYHIVGRDKNLIKVFEVSYDLIDKKTIEILSESKSSLKFKDSKNEYNFNFSKSVLMKRFIVPDHYLEIDINIIDDPLEVLISLQTDQAMFSSNNKFVAENGINYSKVENEELVPGIDFMVLPLYSPKAKKNHKEPIVPEKSQLNQWNAGGRKRDPGEVYIFIPKSIHKINNEFFPERDSPFMLQIPSGEILDAKVCQGGNKALMTNPNKALAEWMLRKILRLGEGELLTYNRLRAVGYDCVKITKINSNHFMIDFGNLDDYENFIDSFDD